MSCQIKYNTKGEVEKVYASNGNESLLYKNALKTNAAEDAVKIWAVGNTEMFKEEVQPKDLDKNGEPNLKTVLAYIATKNTTEQLTPQEIFEVGQSLIGTNFTNANELAIQLKSALLIPTKQTLKSLNLYNNSEISDILNDPILKNKILEMAQKIINTDAEITQNTEVNSDYIRVNPNFRDALGKYQMNNPNILEANIIQELGGIKNEDEFNQKLQDSGFEVGKNPDNSQNKATTELVTEYLKAKLGQDISILPESEILEKLEGKKVLSINDRVYGFYDQNTKQTFLTEEFLSSKSAIHEMWHSVKPSIKISAKKDKTAELLLKTMNNLVNEAGFNEKQVREEYKASNKNGVGVNPMITSKANSKLKLAEKLEKEGKTNQEIYLKTGWERGKDNIWRVEIPNGTYIRLPEIDGITGVGDRASLVANILEVLKADELYKMYPELKKTTVYFQILPYGLAGYAVVEKNVIVIDKNLSDGKVYTTILHELQHKIQSIEGLSGGGSVDDYIRKEINELKREPTSAEKEEIEQRAFEQYKRLAGEVEARNVETRTYLSEEQRKITMLSESEDRPRNIQTLKNITDISQAYAPRQNESENEYVDRMREEVEANLLGENSVEYFDRIAKENNLTDKEKASFISKVKAFIKNFASWLAKQIGFQNLTPEQASKLTTKDVLDRVTTSILKGQYKNSLFEDLSKYNKISVVENINGVISPKKDNKTSETIKATLQEDESNVVRNAISDLEGYSNAIWTSSPQAVKTLLKSLENKAKNISLDLEGLENSYNVKSQAQILELLRSLDYLLNNINEENQNYFINTFEEFFNIEKQDEVAIELVDEKFRNKPLVKLETKDSDYKVFKELGLLRVGKSIYMKTDALKKSLQEVEDLMLANKMEISEDEMYKEYTSDADYDLGILKKLASYRMYFGAENIKNSKNEIRVPQLIENEEYLKTDFIGDLYKEYLKDKSNPVLSNLQFGKKGITIKNTDIISILELNNYLESNQNLKNYLQLNKNTEFEIANDNIISERDELINGKVKEEFQDNFRKINDDVIQAETYENFITINKENFERVEKDFFIKLPSNTTEFYQLDNEQPQLRINTDDYISQKSLPKVEIKNKYSVKQGQEIDNEIECK